MEIKEFQEKIKNKAQNFNIELNDIKVEKLYNYMNILLEWNEKINLTAITDKDDIILKHFIDSLTISKYITDNSCIIDVGTGAGFPGIPLNIYNSENKYVLLDSLNKRVKFLDEVINVLKLKNIKTFHSRAEDFAIKNREKFDIATSRAVAPLNILLEYMLPLVKVGGKCICMKGNNIEEIAVAKNALNILGGKIEEIEEISLTDKDNMRNIIIIRKVKPTPNKYPRKAGTPTKEPL